MCTEATVMLKHATAKPFKMNDRGVKAVAANAHITPYGAPALPQVIKEIKQVEWYVADIDFDDEDNIDRVYVNMANNKDPHTAVPVNLQQFREYFCQCTPEQYLKDGAINVSV